MTKLFLKSSSDILLLIHTVHNHGFPYLPDPRVLLFIHPSRTIYILYLKYPTQYGKGHKRTDSFYSEAVSQNVQIVFGNIQSYFIFLYETTKYISQYSVQTVLIMSSTLLSIRASADALSAEQKRVITAILFSQRSYLPEYHNFRHYCSYKRERETS